MRHGITKLEIHGNEQNMVKNVSCKKVHFLLEEFILEALTIRSSAQTQNPDSFLNPSQEEKVARGRKRGKDKGLRQ